VKHACRFALLFLFSSLLFRPAAAETVVIDNRSDFFSVQGSWSTGTMAGYHIVDYRYIATSLTETATATFAPQFPSAGVYEVAVWYVQGANRPTDAKFIIHHAGGATTVSVDQTTSGSRWVTLGQWEFPAAGGAVAVSNQSATAGKVAVADAVRFVRAGTT